MSLAVSSDRVDTIMKNKKQPSLFGPVGRRRFLQTVAVVSGAAVAVPRSQRVQAASAADTTRSQQALYMTDLDRCQPASALSRKPQRNHWTLLDYETDTLKGTMLVAGQNTAAPQVTYPLNRTGWHAIYFGIRSYGYGEDGTRLLARLSSDSTFALISHQSDRGTHNRIDDVFWKSADLTGKEIVLGQLSIQVVPSDPNSVGNPCHGAWVAYIKLVPLSDPEVKRLKKDRNRKENRRLWAHNDAWSHHYAFRPVNEADIRREIEPLRDTDFSRLYWEAAAGDRCNYFTKIGLMPSDDWIKDPYRVGDRLAGESWRILRKKGIDPFKVALDYCHEIGLEFHAAYRTGGFHFPAPHGEWNSGGYYDAHAEWRGTDRQGRPTPRLSYAYPEVRQFVVSLLKEMAAYPIDGVCLLYNRRPPLVEYAPPVVEGFKARYGEDPRQLDPRDPRWLSFRATFLTQFMQEVREAMNQVGREQRRNKAPKVSAIVMSSRQENLYYGMDLEAWIKEGLVDAIIPYSSVKGLNRTADSWVEPRDAEFFLRITKGTGCKLALNLMPRQISPEQYRRRAHRLYQAGVEYFFFWDASGRNDFSHSWDVLRRLGHCEELEAWVREGSPELERTGSTLRKLGDWDLSYVTPG